MKKLYATEATEEDEKENINKCPLIKILSVNSVFSVAKNSLLLYEIRRSCNGKEGFDIAQP